MITDNYIKMCEKAREIQKLWRKKIDPDMKYTCTQPNYEEGCIARGIEGLTYCDKCEWNTVYLPTQEQLQEMILISKKYDDMFILNNFLCDFMIDDLDKKIRSNMNECWLAFVMKEKWNKIWNGKEWVKYENNN